MQRLRASRDCNALTVFMRQEISSAVHAEHGLQEIDRSLHSGCKKEKRHAQPRASRLFLSSELSSFLQYHGQRQRALLHHLRCNRELLHLLVARHVIHQVEHQLLKDHP